jgi:type III secretory pathway component EscS
VAWVVVAVPAVVAWVVVVVPAVEACTKIQRDCLCLELLRVFFLLHALGGVKWRETLSLLDNW